VPVGSHVSARVRGVACGRDAVDQDPTYGAVYALNVPADDPATPAIEGGQAGDTVTFVLELPGGGECPLPQTATWQGGFSAQVDLAFWQSVPAVVLPLILLGS